MTADALTLLPATVTRVTPPTERTELMTTPSSDARRRDRSSGVETLVRLLVVLQVITLIALAVLLHRVVSLDGRLDDLSGQISNVGL